MNSKHGFSRTRFWWIWTGLRRRKYAYSVKVCKRWQIFNNFKNDMYESYLEHCEKFGEKNTTIDRINNSIGYAPHNCRWATLKEQMNNKGTNRLITFEGKTLNLKQWSEEYGIKYTTLHQRLNGYKWSFSRAINKH